jgi:hypothetical protein
MTRLERRGPEAGATGVGREKKRNFSRIGKKPEGEGNPWEHSERAKMRRRGLMMHLKCWRVVEGDWRLGGGEITGKPRLLCVVWI